MILMQIASVPFVAYFLLFDLKLAKDRPVILSRTGNVFVYERAKNPFKCHPITIKRFRWEGIQAEIAEFKAFNGKTYYVRYALIMVVCKPGTTEVVKRFELKGNWFYPAAFDRMWGLCVNI